ncbi:RodZ domain-containing protein [Rhodopila sp.]|uniref:helix-turn-helix domain-containing protein n=1 Tax=Rhodopila sp. TaxID=2480087 RepID=UPI003D12FC4D
MMSTIVPRTETLTAGRVGSALRIARERLVLALPDIAASLHIRQCHLEALEAGDIALLPGNAYAVGFVRSYARALGLDAEEMVKRFKAEAAAVDSRTDLVFPVPMPDRGLPAGAVMLLGLVLSIGAYVGWYRLSGEGRLPAETVTAIPERLAPLAEQALPAPVAEQALPAPARSVIAAAIQPQPPSQVAPADPAPAVSLVSPTSAAAALVREPIPDQVPDQVMAPPAAAAAPPTVDPGRIVLRASADAWLQVKDRNGVILLNRTIKAGETWPVPRQDNLLLTTGNAGGTDILVDGVATPSLGASGTVRRDMPLDPDQIRDGKLAAALAPQLASNRPRQ